MKDFIELTGDSDVADWTPTDTFCDMIIYALHCNRVLSGKVTVGKCNFARGKGETITIRSIAARLGQGRLTGEELNFPGIGDCDCLDPVASSFSATAVTLKAFGDYDKICEQSIFKAGDIVKQAILQEMGEAMADLVDEYIFYLLGTVATPDCSYDLGDPNCGCFANDLYNLVIDAEASRRGAGYDPDFVIMHPTVAALFKYKDTADVPRHMTSQIVVKDGILVRIGSLNVIEYCGANAFSAVADTVLAVLLDSSRAVAEAWGKRPSFEEERIPECDAWKEVVWMYLGCGIIDEDAICHIKNPAA